MLALPEARHALVQGLDDPVSGGCDWEFDRFRFALNTETAPRFYFPASLSRKPRRRTRCFPRASGDGVFFAVIATVARFCRNLWLASLQWSYFDLGLSASVWFNLADWIAWDDWFCALPWLTLLQWSNKDIWIARDDWFNLLQ